MQRFPDFFLIGAPKCGTTSLFSWLQKHPDTFLPVKEPGFLSLDLLDVRQEANGLQTQAAYFNRLCPPETEALVTGEATPKYLYSDAALERLSTHAGKIKLIVMLRNPVDLAIAMHAQNLRQGREREPDFSRAWERGPAQPQELLTDYRFWGQPGARLERWLQQFDRNDIKVWILEEEMRNAPAKVYADTLGFLGLSPHELDSYAAENPRRSYRSPRLQGASRRLRRGVYGGLAKLGIKPPSTGMLRVVDKINGNRPNRTMVAPELRMRIAAELTEDAMRMAYLLGRTQMPWPDFEWNSLPEQVGSRSMTQ